MPLVPTAILFDLGLGDPRARPGRELAEQALAAVAAGPVPVGSVGAGTGATVGKARGLPCAMKGGFGFASAVGAGRSDGRRGGGGQRLRRRPRPRPGRLVAGCRTAPDSRELAGAERILAHLPADTPHPWEGNTTLAVVMTDAALPKAALLKVCQMAFGGLYRALAPALTLYDGDLVVTLSRGEVRAHVNQVGVLAEAAVGAAVVTAVSEADGFGLVPAVRDLG